VKKHETSSKRTHFASQYIQGRTHHDPLWAGRPPGKSSEIALAGRRIELESSGCHRGSGWPVSAQAAHQERYLAHHFHYRVDRIGNHPEYIVVSEEKKETPS
jgi:hypothetical protein